jgi:uncharacterized membrane protein
MNGSRYSVVLLSHSRSVISHPASPEHPVLLSLPLLLLLLPLPSILLSGHPVAPTTE